MISRTWRGRWLMVALDAAEHGVGLAANDRERCDHGIAGANHRARRFRRHAAPAGYVDRTSRFVARTVPGLTRSKSFAGLDREPEPLDAAPLPRDVRPGSPRQFFLQHHLRGAQYASSSPRHRSREPAGLGFWQIPVSGEAGTEREALQLRRYSSKFLIGRVATWNPSPPWRPPARCADQPRIECLDQRARSKALRSAAVKAQATASDGDRAAAPERR